MSYEIMKSDEIELVCGGVAPGENGESCIPDPITDLITKALKGGSKQEP